MLGAGDGDAEAAAEPEIGEVEGAKWGVGAGVGLGCVSLFFFLNNVCLFIFLGFQGGSSFFSFWGFLWGLWSILNVAREYWVDLLCFIFLRNRGAFDLQRRFMFRGFAGVWVCGL